MPDQIVDWWFRSDEQSSVQIALSAAQNEEEAILQEALRQRREQFGPPANLEPAPTSQQPFSFGHTPLQAAAAAAGSKSNGYTKSQETSKVSGRVPGKAAAAAQANSNSQAKTEPVSWLSLTKPPGNEGKQVDPADFPAPQQQTAPAGFVQLGQKPEEPSRQ